MIDFNKFYKSYIKIQKKAYFNIETTSRCRLQCPFCQRQRKGGKEKVKQAGEMSYQDMRKIYNFTDNINFCGQISDPIYHTDFLKILEKIIHLHIWKRFILLKKNTEKYFHQ